MSKLSLLLADKKAEFWVRCAAATQYLEPAAAMGLVERIFYAQLSRISRAMFLSFAKQELYAKERKMAEEACKHDMAGPDAKFCPGCGGTLGGDPEIDAYIDRRFKILMGDYDVKPKVKADPKGDPKGDPKKKSLADKLGLKKGDKK